jgi:hypothetical protein
MSDKAVPHPPRGGWPRQSVDVAYSRPDLDRSGADKRLLRARMFIFHTGLDAATAFPSDFDAAQAWLIGVLGKETHRDVVRSITLDDVRDAETQYQSHAAREAQRLHDEGEYGPNLDPHESAWWVRHHRQRARRMSMSNRASTRVHETLIRSTHRGRTARKVVAGRASRPQSRRVSSGRSPDDPSSGDDPPRPLAAEARRDDDSGDSPLQRVHQAALAEFTTPDEWAACADIFARRAWMLGFARQVAA